MTSQQLNTVLIITFAMTSLDGAKLFVWMASVATALGSIWALGRVIGAKS